MSLISEAKNKPFGLFVVSEKQKIRRNNRKINNTTYCGYVTLNKEQVL